MEIEISSSWLKSLMETNFGFLCFTYIIYFFALLFLRFIFSLYNKKKPWCNCETCKSFICSKWSKEFNNICDWYTHLLQNSSTGTIHVHVLGNVITTNPENVEYILKTNFDNYPKGKPFSVILGDLLGRGIFNVDGDSWKFQRKMASLEINNTSTRSYAFEVVTNEIQNRLIPLLSSFAVDVAFSNDRNGRRVLDLQDVFQRFSFDNICIFSFGWDPNCLDLSLPTSNFAEAFDLASKLSAERAMTATPLIWKLKKLLNIGSEKHLRQAIKTIHVLAEEVIIQKRNAGGFFTQKDLLSRFMATIGDDDEFLRDIVVSFLLAGRDTVASALTSFFWLLSKHPKVGDAIRIEADKVMAENPDLSSIQQLREMHYLQAAVYESLRLYPPVQFDSKFCEEDDILPDGTFVKKGTRVTYHPYAMGRMESIWGQDCLEFKPERWLQADGVFKHENPFKFPVFQAGFRVCLGKEMAIMEIKCVALALIRQFDIKVAIPHDQAPRFMPGLTATVRGGLPVFIQQRSH